MFLQTDDKWTEHLGKEEVSRKIVTPKNVFLGSSMRSLKFMKSMSYIIGKEVLGNLMLT